MVPLRPSPSLQGGEETHVNSHSESHVYGVLGNFSCQKKDPLLRAMLYMTFMGMGIFAHAFSTLLREERLSTHDEHNLA